MREDLKYPDESYRIRGAIYEVYRTMGPGFLEAVYQECLQREMALRGIPHVAQPMLQLAYKGETLRQVYEPDFICYSKIVVELKAAKDISVEHRAQLHNYLRATRLELGFLINFGHHLRVQIERVVY